MKDPIRPFDDHPVTSLRQWSTQIPVDLVCLTLFVALSIGILVAVDSPPLFARAAVGFPLLFLAPGYATVSTLFPRASPTTDAPASRLHLPQQVRSVTDSERFALSFGLSVAVLPVIGLAIAASPWEFTQSAVVGAVSAFVLLATVSAALRRHAIPPSERYRIRLGHRLGSLYGAVFDTDSRAHTAVNLFLVLSLLLAASTVGYALITPQDGERYSSVQLLTEDEDGDLVAGGYPSNITAGESGDVTVAVENNERETIEYELVVVIERIQLADDEAVVIDRDELDRFESTVDHGETWTHQHELAPDMTGSDLRVSYYLYKGDAPTDPMPENAYRHTYIWIDVE